MYESRIVGQQPIRARGSFKADPVPITRMPCGQEDPSLGNLWACVRHARKCEHKRCREWLAWFETFRYDFLASHGRYVSRGTDGAHSTS